MLQMVATTGVDLDNVYDRTLRRIKEQKGGKSRLGIEVLMWVSHAERPLRIEELCRALAVEMGATDIDLENIRPQDTVLMSCLGLAMVDRETSTVRLIHYSLQEYLSRPGVLPDAHRTLSQTCLTYLNYDQVKGLPADSVSNLDDMPFLEYSSLYWGRHAKMELTDHTKSLALGLLNRYDSHISSALLFKKINPYARSLSHRPFPSLHCASYFGIDEIVAALFKMEGCDINQRDIMGFTPLKWAAWQGNQGTVALLLTRDDIDPDKPGDNGETPLLAASGCGHAEVVRLLLERNDVNPDKPDNHGRTPLWLASGNGHERVVRLLLTQNDVNPTKPNNDGITPLQCASSDGHEGVVSLLLSRGATNPDQPDNNSLSLLPSSSSSGHEEVSRPLVTQGDANLGEPDSRQGQPRISSMLRYRRIIAEHVPRLWVKNKKGQQPL